MRFTVILLGPTSVLVEEEEEEEGLWLLVVDNVTVCPIYGCLLIIYREWIKLGINPKKNNKTLIKKSFVKNPLFIQTATGGTKIDTNTRNQSRVCILYVMICVSKS